MYFYYLPLHICWFHWLPSTCYQNQCSTLLNHEGLPTLKHRMRHWKEFIASSEIYFKILVQWPIGDMPNKKVRVCTFLKSLNFRGHPGKLKSLNFIFSFKALHFSASFWKLLEFSSTLNLVAWKVFLMLFACPRQNINRSEEKLKVIKLIQKASFVLCNNNLRWVNWKLWRSWRSKQFKP